MCCTNSNLEFPQKGKSDIRRSGSFFSRSDHRPLFFIFNGRGTLWRRYLRCDWRLKLHRPVHVYTGKNPFIVLPMWRKIQWRDILKQPPASSSKANWQAIRNLPGSFKNPVPNIWNKRIDNSHPAIFPQEPKRNPQKANNSPIFLFRSSQISPITGFRGPLTCCIRYDAIQGSSITTRAPSMRFTLQVRL